MTTTTEIFHVEKLGSVFVVTPLRDLRELEYQEIEREILYLASNALVRRIVVDFAHTDYFGSTAVGMLTLLCQRVIARGGRVAFCNLSDHEREILEVTELLDRWPIYRTRREAMQAVRR